jgi:hypothetical protein
MKHYVLSDYRNKSHIFFSLVAAFAFVAMLLMTGMHL